MRKNRGCKELFKKRGRNIWSLTSPAARLSLPPPTLIFWFCCAAFCRQSPLPQILVSGTDDAMLTKPAKSSYRATARTGGAPGIYKSIYVTPPGFLIFKNSRPVGGKRISKGIIPAVTLFFYGSQHLLSIFFQKAMLAV